MDHYDLSVRKSIVKIFGSSEELYRKIHNSIVKSVAYGRYKGEVRTWSIQYNIYMNVSEKPIRAMFNFECN